MIQPGNENEPCFGLRLVLRVESLACSSALLGVQPCFALRAPDDAEVVHLRLGQPTLAGWRTPFPWARVTTVWLTPILRVGRDPSVAMTGCSEGALSVVTCKPFRREPCAATFFVLDRRPGTLPLAPRGKKGDPQSAPHHDFCSALLRVATVYLPVLPCRFPVLAAAQG